MVRASVDLSLRIASAVLTMRALVEILIVDDSDEDVCSYPDCLRTAAPGMTVLRLRDGEQALHFIWRHRRIRQPPCGAAKARAARFADAGHGRNRRAAVSRARPDMREMPVVIWTSTSNPVFIEKALAGQRKRLPREAIGARPLSRRNRHNCAALVVRRRDRVRNCQCEAQRGTSAPELAHAEAELACLRLVASTHSTKHPRELPTV